MTERQNTHGQLALSSREGIRPLKWGRLQATAVDDFISDEIGFRFASLVDGEGCFSIHKNSATGQWQVDFVINMRADDRPFLLRVRAGIGDPGVVSDVLPPTRPDQKPHAHWRITSKGTNLWLVSVFDFFPLWSKKRRDYAVWREAVLARSIGRGAGHAVLERTFHEIRAVREYADA